MRSVIRGVGDGHPRGLPYTVARLSIARCATSTMMIPCIRRSCQPPADRLRAVIVTDCRLHTCGGCNPRRAGPWSSVAAACRPRGPQPIELLRQRIYGRPGRCAPRRKPRGTRYRARQPGPERPHGREPGRADHHQARPGRQLAAGPPPGLDKTYVLMSACAAALSKTPCFVRSGTVLEGTEQRRGRAERTPGPHQAHRDHQEARGASAWPPPPTGGKAPGHQLLPG